MECPAVTPDPVLRASGHVDRFTDYMVTDLVTGDCHRADHLLKAALEAALEDKTKIPSPEEIKVLQLPSSFDFCPAKKSNPSSFSLQCRQTPGKSGTNQGPGSCSSDLAVEGGILEWLRASDSLGVWSSKIRAL